MRCPKCHSLEDKVIDSRVSRDGASIRRRRECLACGHRFSTTEQMLREDLIVIKRDGRREDFDLNKLVLGLRKACEKRPVDQEQLGLLIETIMESLEKEYDQEIPSQRIGEKVMEQLKVVDPIAYLRYASVYKDFRDLSEVLQEISQLQPK